MEKNRYYYELIQNHVRENLPRIFKKPNDCLKYPFLDPGSIYDGNLWDWDTFWTSYALIHFERTQERRDDSFKEMLTEHMKGNIQNFFDHQLPDGYIPMMIEKTELPEPYLIMKHKEGHVLNMHKPFLCQQICIISGYTGSFEWAKPYLDNLERYFRRYDEDYFNQRCSLYVWADDVMIGVDNDPTIFGRPRFSTAGIYLNSFMVRELKAMAKILNRLDMTERSGHYSSKTERLTEAIQYECWDERDRFYYSVDADIKTRSYDWFHKGLGVFWNSLPIRIRVWSGFIPMLAGISTEKQNEGLLVHLNNPDAFCAPYGVRTLSKEEKMYTLDATNNPSNWLGPIWAIANYAVFRGLIKNGYTDEAAELCEKTLMLLGQDIEKTGTMHEYYVPEDGLPVMSPDFMNWNMLALNMYDELNGAESVDSYLD